MQGTLVGICASANDSDDDSVDAGEGMGEGTFDCNDDTSALAPEGLEDSAPVFEDRTGDDHNLDA